MTASSNKLEKQQQFVAAAGPVVFLASVTGRTPAVPENASSSDAIRLRPTDEQIREADAMAREVGDEKAYRDDFGKRAPDPAAVTSSLVRARALSDETARAEAWLAYLKSEAASAWQDALEKTTKLREHFDIAARADPNIALRYPSAKVFFSARAEIAARALATRKKNRVKTP